MQSCHFKNRSPRWDLSDTNVCISFSTSIKWRMYYVSSWIITLNSIGVEIQSVRWFWTRCPLSLPYLQIPERTIIMTRGYFYVELTIIEKIDRLLSNLSINFSRWCFLKFALKKKQYFLYLMRFWIWILWNEDYILVDIVLELLILFQRFRNFLCCFFSFIRKTIQMIFRDMNDMFTLMIAIQLWVSWERPLVKCHSKKQSIKYILIFH